MQVNKKQTKDQIITLRVIFFIIKDIKLAERELYFRISIQSLDSVFMPCKTSCKEKPLSVPTMVPEGDSCEARDYKIY